MEEYPSEEYSAEAYPTEEKRKFSTAEVILLVVIGLIILATCFVGGSLLTNLLPGKGTPIPATSVPDQDLCTRYQSTGKLIVGISADYQPFEYYTTDFKLTGFDIALMQAVAGKLGLQTEYRDMAFDGLGNALLLGQIDAAISAISVTPERAAQFLFSNIYFVSEAGVLARVDAPIPSITSPDQLAAYRIGVQTASVYQGWIESTMVETGKMSAGQVFAYPLIQQAASDLTAGRIDLILMDYEPAVSYQNQGGYKLVGTGGSQQYYAIGLNPCATTLLGQVNQALTELQNEGVIAQLIQQYLNLSPDQILPTPTPQPGPTATPLPPTPTPPGACIDGMAFVKDLTYPDKNMTDPPELDPGEAFQKGWRIQNTGTCTWDSRYYLAYTDGNAPGASMGGVPTYVRGTVPPGGSYDMYLSLVAPLTPGIYQGFWGLFNPTNLAFGDRLWVGIEVVPVNPATPTPVPGRPEVYRFTVNPSSIQAGQCTVVSWEVIGQVSQVNLLRNNTLILQNAPLNGSYQDCLSTPGVYTYQIQANGPGGSASAERQLSVNATPPPTSTPPPIYPPVISSFTVQPSTIQQGACVDISWIVDGTVQLVRLFRNSQIIQDNAPSLGNAVDCPTQTGNNVYRLEASGAGQLVGQERGVNVQAAPPTATPVPVFVDIPWSLQEIYNAQAGLQPIIPGTQVLLTLNADNTFTGSGGCNQYSGTYQAQGDSIRLSVSQFTQMFCAEPAGIMEQEQAYLSLLSMVYRYQASTSQLVLTDDHFSPLLEYSVAVSPR